MSKNFNYTRLACAITALSLTSLAGAAGLDRSGQPSEDFSSDGTLAYVSAVHISPSLSGVEADGKVISDTANEYQFYGYGAKTDVNDQLSVGVFYDQPFGADVEYQGKNSLVDYSNPDNIKPSTATVRTENFTGLLGIKLGENNNFKIYGGPVLQKIKAEVDIHGDPAVLTALNGYALNIPTNTEYGYMVGAAYVKPEIALKAAVTYRSEIAHNVTYEESMPVIDAVNPTLPPALRLSSTQTKTDDLTLPKSVNIDFQTGLNKTTLLTAKARWVPWSEFKIVPPLLSGNAVALNSYKQVVIKEAALLSYGDDSYQLELGLAKRLSPILAVSGTVGWDSGAGNPVSPLGPAEGYYSVGLGAKYNVTPNWAVSAGAKYLMLGDADGQLAATKKDLGRFEDNSAYVVGVKLSYQAK
ncbi:MAG: outer membrane beta-barrel protein [Psychrobacter sp.]|nr:outer membrane beta-barrel protein [Psychrobacter sp.]